MSRLLFIAFLVLQAALLLYSLIYVPVHWDEGWNLCVARTWFEEGHYGCKIMGQLTTARLSTGWFPVFLTKIGFELTGVHYLGGRIPMALILIPALIACYKLSRELFYSKSAGYLSIILFLCLTPDSRLNPILLASQAYSEVLCIAFLLWAYWLLHRGIRDDSSHVQHILFLLGASTLFFLAFHTKYLAMPFTVAGLSVAGLFLILRRRWWNGCALIACAALSYLLFMTVTPFFYPVSAAQIVSEGSGTSGLFSTLAINFDPELRLRVLKYMIKWYWVLLLALLFSTYNLWRQPKSELLPAHSVVIAMSSTIILWSGWFFLLSVDFPRYYAIPSALSAPLLAYWIVHVLQLESTPDIISAIKHKVLSSPLIPKALALSLVTFLTIQLALTPIIASKFIHHFSDYNVEMNQVAKSLNETLINDQFVETYETALFHLLTVPYHYPPDQINIESIAKHTGKLDSMTHYNWRSLQPEIVVRGDWSSEVYDLYLELEVDPSFQKNNELEHFTIFRAADKP